MSSRSGQGHVYRPRYTDRHGSKKLSCVWWIGYSVNGKKYRESSKSRFKRDAVALLSRRLGDRSAGVTERELEQVTFDELVDLLRVDYENKGNRSDRLEDSLTHLCAAFSGWNVVAIDRALVERYKADRKASGAAVATINRELAALRRMFNLGRDANKVGKATKVTLFSEKNVRKGFFERNQLDDTLDHLPDHLRPLVLVGYMTGWRKGELLSRRWHHVDFDAGWIRIEPGESKNEDGRQFPLFPELRAVLEQQWTRKKSLERATGRIIPDLFFYYHDGRPVKDFRGAWESAVGKAGHPELLFHDLRRTAVRNMIRAGLSETVAMKLTGHKTRSVFTRYAICDETLLEEQAAKLSAVVGQRRVKDAEAVAEQERDVVNA